jgi:molybdopterin adenylyltransferase
VSEGHSAEPAAIKIGILTVSDRASRGAYADEGGPAIEAYLNEVLTVPWQADSRIVPDDLNENWRTTAAA